MVYNPPTVDPAGHQLHDPNVRVGWSPCDCARADGSPTGHDYVECLTCHWEWRSPACDKYRDGYPINPPHRGTGNPGDPGYPGQQA